MAQQIIGIGAAPNDGTGDNIRIGGDKINDNFTELYALSITREVNRAFSEELLFDKNEISYEVHEAIGDLSFTIATSGHLEDQFCSSVQTIIVDGTQSISFTGFNFIYGIVNGTIPDAGTYQIFFLHINSVTSVHWAEPSSEEANLTLLPIVANFAAVPGTDPETEMDLTWDDSANESSYEIQFSTSGGSGPWATLTSPAAGSTSYTHTGLTANTTYHYRIRAVGDMVIYQTSSYTTTAATTEDGADVTAPQFTFLPASGNTDWPVNKPIIITADEALRDADGVTVITSANVADYLTLKETNSGGTDISFTATIDASKTVITITPDSSYGQTQLVYVAIDGVEDVNGNEISGPISSTFTTTEFTIFDGVTNRLQFGDILDSLWAANDTNFWLECTIDDAVIDGSARYIISKYATSGNQRSFGLFYLGSDVYFVWFPIGGGNNRTIKWAGAMTAGEHDYVLKYDGSIDTNDGLDRCILEVDGVVAGSKTVSDSIGTLGNIFNGTAQLAVGAAITTGGTIVFPNLFAELMKDFIVRSNAGATVEINVPDLASGIDISGNARNGTWV